MNVAWRPCRIQAIRDDQMILVNEAGQQVYSPPLSEMEWEAYCDEAARWLAKEGKRLEKERQEDAEASKRMVVAELLGERISAQEYYRAMLAREQLLASGYGSTDDLEREVVLVDLEDTDPVPILEVDCQMTLDELRRKNSEF
jgi:hypothetical protein